MHLSRLQAAGPKVTHLFCCLWSPTPPRGTPGALPSLKTVLVPALSFLCSLASTSLPVSGCEVLERIWGELFFTSETETPTLQLLWPTAVSSAPQQCPLQLLGWLQVLTHAAAAQHLPMCGMASSPLTPSSRFLV